MTTPHERSHSTEQIFGSAQWYDESINWEARFGRELPVFERVFGAPSDGGIIDAGCGPGRHAAALAKQGYRVVGVDGSEEMLAVAEAGMEGAAERLKFAHATYDGMFATIGSGFDGLYCIGNSLAAAGSERSCAGAISQFARCLRRGGRMLIQILNFAPMRSRTPCIRGPRLSRVAGRDYISVRQFHFSEDSVQVTNITLFDEDGWRQRSTSGTLYAIKRDELQKWCSDSDLRIDETLGDYQATPYNIEQSTDLIIIATRL